MIRAPTTILLRRMLNISRRSKQAIDATVETWWVLLWLFIVTLWLCEDAAPLLL